MKFTIPFHFSDPPSPAIFNHCVILPSIYCSSSFLLVSLFLFLFHFYPSCYSHSHFFSLPFLLFFSYCLLFLSLFWHSTACLYSLSSSCLVRWLRGMMRKRNERGVGVGGRCREGKEEGGVINPKMNQGPSGKKKSLISFCLSLFLSLLLQAQKGVVTGLAGL